MDNQYGAFGDPMILPNKKPEPPPPQEVTPPLGKPVENVPSAKLDIARLEIRREHAIEGRELICEMRKTSLFLYDAFTELVRKIYRDNLDTIVGTPTRKWGRTPQHDGIWVDTELNWKPANPDFLPAVYVKLGQVQYSSTLGNVNTMAGMDLENGVYEYSRMGAGQVTFVHVARTSGEAVALCDNTRYYLSDFGAQIADDLCFSKFFETGVQPLSPAPKDSKETYTSTVVFSFEFFEDWRIKHESPILKSVDLLQEDSRYGILSLKGTKDDLHRREDDGRGHQTSTTEEKVDG